MDEMRWLQGTTLILTGGSSGIGKAVLTSALAAGANVINLSRSYPPINPEEHIGKLHHIEVDICDSLRWGRLKDEFESIGLRPNYFVNAATVRHHGPIDAANIREWEDVFRSNVFFPMFLWNDVVGPSIDRCSGAAVFLSSGGPRQLQPSAGVYSASRSALETAVKILARECAPTGIRLNIVVPGPTDTPGLHNSIASGHSLSVTSLIERIPLGRVASPDEIANAIFFLLSPKASYVTGAILVTNGGLNV